MININIILLGILLLLYDKLFQINAVIIRYKKLIFCYQRGNTFNYVIKKLKYKYAVFIFVTITNVFIINVIVEIFV